LRLFQPLLKQLPNLPRWHRLCAAHGLRLRNNRMRLHRRGRCSTHTRWIRPLLLLLLRLLLLLLRVLLLLLRVLRGLLRFRRGGCDSFLLLLLLLLGCSSLARAGHPLEALGQGLGAPGLLQPLIWPRMFLWGRLVQTHGWLRSLFRCWRMLLW